MNALYPSDLAALLSSEFCVRLTQTLLHFLWQGLLIGLVVWMIDRLMPRASSRFRYAAGVSALGLMLACIPATYFAVGLLSPSAQAGVANREPQPNVEAIPSPTAATAQVAVVEAPISDVRALEDDSLAPAGVASRATSIWAWQTLRSLPAALAPYATFGYLLGVAVMLARLALALRSGHVLRHSSTPLADPAILAMVARQAQRIGLKVVPAVAWCQRAAVPLVVGIVKPVVLLPTAIASGLSPDHLESLLAHELAHLKRLDLAVNLVQRLAESLLFFHPAVWYVSRRISSERENCCDDCVLAAGWGRVEYADALVRMAEVCHASGGLSPLEGAALLAASGEGPSQFKRRVLRLLDADDHLRIGLSRGWLLAAALAVLLAFVALPLASPWKGEAAAQPKEAEQAQSPANAVAAHPGDDPLEAVKQASVDSSEKLRSAAGVGTFEHYVQGSGDKEPMLTTKGRAKVYFKQGKYHLRLDYETMLQRTVYTNRQGNKLEKLVEWKPDREFMIFDGISASVVTFSDRIRPRGCEGEVFAELRRPWGDPARLGKQEMDVVKLIENLGKTAIQVTRLPDGIFRFTYRVKNSNKVRGEFDADPDFGFNVVATRVFNEGEMPAQASRLTWRKSSGVWYVEAIEVLHDFRRLNEPGSLTRWVFKFDTMDVNVEVDPSLFSISATGPPIGTRFLDRRPEAPTPILYYHGSGLTPQRRETLHAPFANERLHERSVEGHAQSQVTAAEQAFDRAREAPADDNYLAKVYEPSRTLAAKGGWAIAWDVQHPTQHGDGERVARLRVFADGRVAAWPGIGSPLVEMGIPRQDVAGLVNWLIDDQRAGLREPAVNAVVDGRKVPLLMDPLPSALWDQEASRVAIVRDGRTYDLMTIVPERPDRPTPKLPPATAGHLSAEATARLERLMDLTVAGGREALARQASFADEQLRKRRPETRLKITADSLRHAGFDSDGTLALFFHFGAGGPGVGFPRGEIVVRIPPGGEPFVDKAEYWTGESEGDRWGRKVSKAAIERLLDKRIGYSATNQPLIFVLSELEKAHKVPVTIDLKEVRSRGLSAQTRVTIDVADKPLREVFKAVLTSAGLNFDVTEIGIFVPAKAKPPADDAGKPAAATQIRVQYDIPGAEEQGQIFVQHIGGRDIIGTRDDGQLATNPVKNGQTLELDKLDPGDYQVARHRLIRLDGLGMSRFLDRQRFKLAAGETKSIDFTRPKGQPVNGKVLGLKDAGLTTAVVNVCAENAKDDRSVSDLDVTLYDSRLCAADGTFQTDRLSPGEYKIIVEGYVITPERLLMSGIIRATYVGIAAVTVPEDGETPKVEVKLEKAGEKVKAKDPLGASR